MSLPEIRATLEDSIQFDIEPLLGIIRSQGITKNAQQLAMCASNTAFQIRLDKEEIEARQGATVGLARVSQSVLSMLPVVAP